MKIISFSVTNYRSITTAHKIKLGQFTVLIGKNNEGKSNILKALNLAMDIMTIYADDPLYISSILRGRYNQSYKWERDFPISLQGEAKKKPTTFDVEFILDEDEVRDLKRITGIRMANIVPVRITITREKVSIDIPKKGSSSFKNHAQEIIQFVCNKITLNYIPAIRTEHDAIRVINRLITKELRQAERSNPEYKEALLRVERLQQDILDEIAQRITEPLGVFLPSIKGISITLDQDNRDKPLRQSVGIAIDDGTLTDIQFKGDGIKSLTALALLNIKNDQKRASVITIEEPESHLHPAAIHNIFETVEMLSNENQIIITTHSPLFVNRKNISNNIIVNSGKATAAKSIRDIRDILGVIVSDNLTNAAYILVVEGESEKIILEKVLPEMSATIKKALKNKTLIIDSMSGCGNLNYALKLHREIQCQYHVLLDNDEAGRTAYEKAENQRLLTLKNVTFTVCDGSADSEIEDSLNMNAYNDAIIQEFGVTLDSPDFRGNEKWSVRAKKCFTKQGKPWGERIEKQLKEVIATALPSNPDLAFNSHKRTWIDALAVALETLLDD